MRFKVKIPALLLLLVVMVAGGGVVHAKESVLVVAPFQIQSEADLAYLERAMMDMFSSRLYTEGKVRVVGRGETLAAVDSREGSVSGENGARLLTELKADYLLFGTLTQSGKGVAIHAGLLQADDLSDVKHFSAKSGEYETVGKLIGLVDKVCAEINRTVFGVSRQSSTESVEAKDTYDIHSHPDNMLEMLKK